MPRKTKVESVAADVLAEDKKPKRGRAYKPKFTKKADAPEPAAGESTITGAPTPVKRKPGQSKQRAALQSLATDGDLVDIWERRLLNPDLHESMPIRISTPGMKIRWINLSNRGRFQRARYEQGWVPVHKSELVDEREIFGVSYTAEGWVCRGEKQGEMLMKIPLAVYRKIQERRNDLNRKSYKKLRDNLGSAGYEHFKEKYGGSAGDVAAESASKFVGEIKFGTERASTTELLE
jgi:hypothetical protein